jgi:hypothetical protein
VLVNGELQPVPQERDDGLIALPIPEGRSTIDVRYTTMPDEVPGDIATLTSILIAGIALKRARRVTL